jgi:arylformamidase
MLSYPLTPESPTPGSIPPVRLERLASIEKDGANVFRAAITSHSGTHVDAPRHMVSSGLSIGDFFLQDFIFSHPCCVDIPLRENELINPSHFRRLENHMQSCDLLLIRSGWWKFRGNRAKYSHENPGFSAAAARYLIDTLPHLKAIGVDFISLAANHFLEEGCQAHRLLFEGQGRHFLIFEDMDLSGNLSSLKRVIALPWLIDGFDSAPCTILGMLENSDISKG